jgi:hypothetical protein
MSLMGLNMPSDEEALDMVIMKGYILAVKKLDNPAIQAS